MNWGEFLTSDAFYGLAALVAMWVWNWLKARRQWDTERWEGMVAQAWLAAEKAGLKTGNEKLDHALGIFKTAYINFYNTRPTAQDFRDAALDLSRKSFESKVGAVTLTTETK